jgi:hypothetical protein
MVSDASQKKENLGSLTVRPSIIIKIIILFL